MSSPTDAGNDQGNASDKLRETIDRAADRIRQEANNVVHVSVSAHDERAAATAPARPDVPPGGSRYGSDPQFAAALKAGIGPVVALWHLLAALRKLAAAEGRMLVAGIPLLLGAATALIAFAVTLWLCLVALIGWALLQGTHSLGLALGLLVVINVILAGCAGTAVLFALNQATFPRARAELRSIGRSLVRDLRAVNRAAPGSDRRGSARGTSDQAGGT